jgi:glycosyltransferase involved in cell wall biosynthesis/2-polyprenyl-3-methyl-5-hydroxy-6-metoxy-1,4-benzoquinol methylase
VLESDHENDMPTTEQRLLIFVVAYYAEASLGSVLERIPPSIFTRYHCEVLVVDDASEDRTYAIGREYQESHPHIRMTVLRNQLNQGYGGNQKVGYTFAIEEGFDYVAMIHGDGQYAPEELPNLVAPLARGAADAVFGSRMLSPFGALKGGMPLYKFVGNHVLTRIQNTLLGTHFSEFHSGYRVYSTAALNRIAFTLNSNEFHFDTEIILQLLTAGLRIHELPIPTYYGNEISRVNGLGYAKNVLLSTLGNTAHRAGLLYQRKYEPVAIGQPNAHYGVKLGYPSSHSYALAAVPEGKRVLDIGSGPGELARELLRKGCHVAVVDQHAPSDCDASVRFIRHDLDAPISFDIKNCDYILLLDIIEHLKDPERFLDDLRRQFDWSPKTVVLTTPNVAFAVQRLMLLLGQFNYGQAGILDRTHTRLFTFRSLRYLLSDAGFRVKEVRGVPAPFPKVLGAGLLGKTAVAANVALIRLSKTLFSYQIFVVAESTPDVRFVLRDAKEHSFFREQRASQTGSSTDDGVAHSIEG